MNCFADQLVESQCFGVAALHRLLANPPPCDTSETLVHVWAWLSDLSVNILRADDLAWSPAQTSGPKAALAVNMTQELNDCRDQSQQLNVSFSLWT